MDENAVEVVGYRPEWPAIFQSEATSIVAALGSLCAGIEHIGSTAVPGMAAKPIVDILVGTRSTSTEAISEALCSIGYEDLGEDGRRPGRWMYRKRSKQNFNVSALPYRGELWRDNILLRDYLRAHPDAMTRYEDAKKQAAAKSPESLLGYQDAKREVVERLKGDARRWTDAVS